MGENTECSFKMKFEVDAWDINLADRARLQEALETAEKAALKVFVESDFVEHRRLYMLHHAPAPAPAPAPEFPPPPAPAFEFPPPPAPAPEFPPPPAPEFPPPPAPEFPPPPDLAVHVKEEEEEEEEYHFPPEKRPRN